jgi:hypothetical protein
VRRVVAPVESADGLHAAWDLRQLAVFADEPGLEPLRALKGAHEVEPPPAAVAWAEAMAVLEELGVVGVFEAWCRGGARAGYWPTSDSRRLRAV